jgi:HTH-type transcriptional regulator, quorum sensing regulator NprR
MNSIGERLREARLARGLTQQALARGLATKGFISQVERNRAMPSLAKLRLLAERLSLPLASLTGEEAPLELAYLRKSAALAIKAGEPGRTLTLVAEAQALARTANERAELLRLRGRALDELQRFPEAIEAHQQAAATAPPDDPELNASIYAEMATVLNQQEQFNAGIEAGLRALKWLDQGRPADPALRSRVLTNLGRSSYGLGQLQRAHHFYEQGLAAARDAESLYRIANAHHSLGVTARALGRLDEAVEHCNRALEIWGRIEQERAANRVLNNLGDAYWAMGKKADAIDYQRRCMTRAAEINDETGVGIAGGALAAYLLQGGKVGEARQLAHRAAAASRASGDHLHQAYAAAVEAAAAERMGHRRVADRIFRQAIGILLEREAGGKLAEVCSMYAEILRERGQYDRAYALLRLAAERDFVNLPALLKSRK